MSDKRERGPAAAPDRIAPGDRPDRSAPRDRPDRDEEVVDARGLLVLPGAIDPHVHFDEPGYTDREDFLHGTSAAASGGVTTVIDMPCTSVPPVTSADNLNAKLAVVSKRAVIDYGLYGGVSGQLLDQDAREAIESLAPHVLGFKCYFISGMETFARVDHRQFEEVLRIARSVDRPVLLHAEDYDYVSRATAIAQRAGNGPTEYHDSRPAEAEVLAVLAAARLARETGADLHIVHVSTGRAAQIIGETPGVTGETGPHYLAFSLSDFISMGSPLKVTPPVKPEPNREQLWRALVDGSLSFVASDHAPAPAKQKHTGSIWTDYAGIPGSGTLLPYLFSEGYRAGRLTLQQLLSLTAGNAARRYGIDHRKGALAVGRDGDCVLIDPTAEWTVRGDDFLSKGKITPFEGMTLQGRISRTVMRGTVVYDRECGIRVKPGHGQQLRRAE